MTDHPLRFDEKRLEMKTRCNDGANKKEEILCFCQIYYDFRMFRCNRQNVITVFPTYLHRNKEKAAFVEKKVRSLKNKFRCITLNALLHFSSSYHRTVT